MRIPTSTIATTNVPKIVPTVVPTARPPSSTATPQGTKLGQTLEQNGYSLTALTVEDPARPGIIYQAEPGKKLVAVEVIVGDVSAKKHTVNPLNATLYDDQGFAYRPDLGGRDGQLALVDLNPGEKARGWISFKIPPQATSKSIKYEFQGYPSIVIQVSLSR